MNFDQIHAKAESESGYLSDNKSVNVYIASRTDDPAIHVINESFQNYIDEQDVNANIISAGSFGYYDIEPVVIIEKPGNPLILYKNFESDSVAELAKDYLVNNNPRPDLAFCTIGKEKTDNIPCSDDLTFFNIQSRIILHNCGYQDPEDINHYILRGGFSGLSGILKIKQNDAIDKLDKSGLRGRGGWEGYLTADKLRGLLETGSDEKIIVCNAADTDPAAFTARLLLTSDPFSILEGMLISAYTTGAAKCILFVDSEYKPAFKIINNALARMKEYGLLGSSIMDSDFSCDIEIKESEISLVSGEESALLRELENKQPMPFLRPPFPEAIELNGKPAIVNNIETFANVTAVFQYGPEKISGTGTANSKGTKIITLADDESAKYTIEVPFGTGLRNIVEGYKNISGDTRNIKAIQFGGPTGAYFAVDTDIIVDFEMIEENSVIGSGALKFLYDTDCAVETAMKITSYLHDQSCGKCVFCREGTFQMAVILEDISKGSGAQQDIDLLNEIGEQMKTGCICQLGRTAASPVLSTLLLFRNEYETHIKEKRCPVNNNSS